jgi:hypothetical protein
MILCAGIPKCISLTYFGFKFMFPGREENLNSYRFIDNLYSGLPQKSKGEPKECKFLTFDF